jgi:hypothetical protein
MLRHVAASGDSEVTELPSTSVDEYAATSGTTPSVLKIDVEGFELDVLAGAERCLRVHRPKIWLELHPNILAEQGSSWEEALEFLKARGYEPICFKDHKLPERDLGFHVWAEWQIRKFVVSIALLPLNELSPRATRGSGSGAGRLLCESADVLL